MHATPILSKKEGNDQESIQSITTPDGKATETQEISHTINQEVSPFRVDDHKTARNRQDSRDMKKGSTKEVHIIVFL